MIGKRYTVVYEPNRDEPSKSRTVLHLVPACEMLDYLRGRNDEYLHQVTEVDFDLCDERGLPEITGSLNGEEALVEWAEPVT